VSIMAKLPSSISGAKVVKILSKLDYKVDHQTGSHIILRQDKCPHRRLTIPNHKNISKGMLRAIIRETGLTRKEFIDLV